MIADVCFSIRSENLTVASSAHIIDAETAGGILDLAPAKGAPNEVPSSGKLMIRDEIFLPITGFQHFFHIFALVQKFWRS